MTPQEFEEALRVVWADYTDAPYGGMGIDYEALAHATATGAAATTPTVTGNTIRRLQARGWLDEAGRRCSLALPNPRQRQDYLGLVLSGIGPRTPRELALFTYARNALAPHLATGGLPWA